MGQRKNIFTDSAIQQFSNSPIQQFSNSAIQQFTDQQFTTANPQISS